MTVTSFDLPTHTGGPRERVVVIGAGIAGLIASWRLSQRGASVTLLEADERLGGAIWTEREGGWRAELGPNTMPDRAYVLSDLIEELGLGDQRLQPNEKANKRYIVREGNPIPIPMSPAQLRDTPLLSSVAKLRLLAELAIPRQPDPDLDESLANFVRRRFGEEVLQYMIDPLVAGTYAGTPQQLSAEHAFKRLVAMERDHGSLLLAGIKGALRRKPTAERRATRDGALINFRDGVQTVVEAISARLEADVHLGARVTHVTRGPQDWEVRWGEGEAARADAVVFAMPSFAMPALAITDAHGHRVDLSFFERLEHPPVTMLSMGYRRAQISHPLDGFGMLCPSQEKREILGTIFASTIFEDRAPAGHALLVAFIGGSRRPDIAGRPLGEQVEIAAKELHALLGVRGDPVFLKARQWSESFPQYEVGHGVFKARVHSIEDDHPGLFFTGNFLEGLSVSDVISHAAKTARRADDFLHLS